MKSSSTFCIAIGALIGLTSAAMAEAPASKHYSLPATAANVQWGWYDPQEPPKLTIHSGDTVSIETLPHALGQIKPGVEMDGIVKLRKQNGGGGPHSDHRADLRRGCGARGYPRDSHPEDRAQSGRFQLQHSRQGFSDRRHSGLGISQRVSFVITNWILRRCRPSSSPGSSSTSSRFPAR